MIWSFFSSTICMCVFTLIRPYKSICIQKQNFITSLNYTCAIEKAWKYEDKYKLKKENVRYMPQSLSWSLGFFLSPDFEGLPVSDFTTYSDSLCKSLNKVTATLLKLLRPKTLFISWVCKKLINQFIFEVEIAVI